ncbi:TIGR03668 family PPOX class F420-dependent oxidoreductase [Phytoactinopolyspora limicola]|uniref:TIGR03668 family PPOX class F420-dependent oxidoreductase n=1 Tax=Phytoactinopolyspora limicola TaxID=2715536 RepID=UPI00140C8538|nr:TIGR03668 family PPOX class F420-dependent oxidoreductase [Phytoactinopolyspora limicola]
MRLSEPECRRRVAQARVARLATVSPDGRPHVVPVTFAVQDDVAVTAVDQKPKSTTSLQRLRNIEANPSVSFVCDRYDDDWTQLWWVRVDGVASIVNGGPTYEWAGSVLAAKYPPYVDDPPLGPVISIVIDRWVGWAYSSSST